MSNARGKTVDTSFLSLDTAESRGFIHRDYIAHCLRWSHVIKQLQKNKLYERATVVDVGCGREIPLAKTMYSSRLIVREYHAIDYGPIPQESRAVFDSGKFPINFLERTDFVQWADSDNARGIADVVVSFEVLEHVEPMHCLAMLNGMRHVLKPDGVAYISTPCWDVVSCAANHVNEMRYETLGAVLEENGWVIRNVFGTFASIREYEPYLAPAHREAFEDLRGYYDVNFLACIFAPFYPQYSRNCLWEIVPRAGSVALQDPPRQFGPLTEVPRPWSSSSRWEDFIKL